MKTNYILLKVLLCIFCLGNLSNAQSELYIATNGSDSNAGDINAPLATLIGARDRARTLGATTIYIRGGRYSFDQTCFLGSQDNGVIFRGYNDEVVIFDGSKFVQPQGFSTVSDQSLLNKLNPVAKGNVKSTVITDPDIITLLTKSTAQISVNDQMKTLARFPNLGFGHVNESTINASGEQINTAGSHTNPVGPQFKMRESFDAAKWSEEASRTQRVAINGYITADWLKEYNQIHSVSTTGEIKLVNGTRYGFSTSHANLRRFFVYNMLYELDEPGEWYFDAEDNRLYIWFTEAIDNNTTIGVWAGPQLFEINNASDISIQRMTIQNIGEGVNGHGAINVKGSSDNILIAGVRFRFIAEPLTAVNFFNDVTNSKVLSCDFYDIPNCSRLYGGEITSTSVTHGNNSIENCHFTQVYSKDFYGKACGITGAGNKFKNNLIHNMNGQPVTHAGVDHVIELNEAFNVGIEEGDGGAFYTGNAMWSFGNIIRHNFVHHIMSVPSLLGRASFFSDDYDAGETLEENVIYKGGWEAIKMNRGGGHSVYRNVVLESYRAIKNSDGGSSAYNSNMNYLTSNPLSQDKANYIGRLLQNTGTSGWQSGLTADNWRTRVEPFWTTRYPFMNNLLNKYFSNKAIRAYECRFYDNMFYNNTEDVSGTSSATEQRSQTLNLSMFNDPSSLDFKFVEPRPSYAPDIPFQNIGLYSDSYRCAVPDKNTYRRNIKQRFDGHDSHTSDPYNYELINNRLYYNTGKMVYATLPCTNAVTEIGEEHEYRFDLGTSSSPVFESYIRIDNSTQGFNFGWVDTTNLSSVDRGTGPNGLNRDFVQSAQPGVFEARVVNGNWKVVITFGDKDVAHDNMRVKAEGNIIFDNVSTQPNVFFNEIANVDVTDGKLTLEFSDQGGTNANWQATRIWLTRNIEAQSAEDSEYKFDLGTTTSALFNGYTRLDHTSQGTNFGWIDTANLDSRDRGAGPNDLNRDFVFSSEAKVFEANVVNGSWNVLVTFGDRDYAHDNMRVKAEGNIIFDNVTSHANEFFNRTADVNVTDGKLTLEFSDLGGTNPHWVATRIWLRRNSSAKTAASKEVTDPEINEALASEVKVYPNPVNAYLHVSVPIRYKSPSYQVMDNLGRVVMSRKHVDNTSQINMQGFSQGLYFLKITLEDGNEVIKRFIKQ